MRDIRSVVLALSIDWLAFLVALGLSAAVKMGLLREVPW